MSTLRVVPFTCPAAATPKLNPLPDLSGVQPHRRQVESHLDEDDGLFVGYGFVDGGYPYRLQDDYERTLEPREFKAVELENDFLRATFLPELGGRLWSLWDKRAERELLFTNPVVRFGNLALRNAWFSGGVEFNCGVVGHHAHTASPLFTAVLRTQEGMPVLRMYQYERIRNATYQMDFFLPNDSPVLYARMRIVNPNDQVIPVYWWSNIAVPELTRGRVIMDATDTYTNRQNRLSKTPVPISEGVDITYPVHNAHSVDFFWRIPKGKRKYVCQLDGEGYGLVQTSTARLKGRKLFVWGQGPGGDKWQEFLSDEKPGGGRYVEIQAGLAHTQYECLPMPPNTAWEWLEAYGPLQCDAQRVHGEWADAVGAAGDALAALVSEDAMDAMLRDTRDSIALKPAPDLLLQGGGWGALENKRRAAQGLPPLSAHLEFGEVKPEQAAWLHLLEQGYLPEASPAQPPVSWMLQEEWIQLLERAVEGADAYRWQAWLQLGCAYFARREFASARGALERSMELEQNPWALYCLAQCERIAGNAARAGQFMLRASLMQPSDYSLAKEALRALLEQREYAAALSLLERLEASVAAHGRIRLYRAYACLGVGDINAAEEILFGGGGIEVADVREGENSVTDLWYDIMEAKAKRDGIPFDRETAQPPAWLDFRMAAEKKK